MNTKKSKYRDRTLHLVICGKNEGRRSRTGSGAYRYYIDGFYDKHNEVAGVTASNDIELAERVHQEAIANCPQWTMDYVERIDYADIATITSWSMVVYCASQEIANGLNESIRSAIERHALSEDFTTSIYDVVDVSVLALTESKVTSLLKGIWATPDGQCLVSTF